MEGFRLDLDEYCKNCDNFVPEANKELCLPEGIIVDRQRCNREALFDLHVNTMIIRCVKREDCRKIVEQFKKNQSQQ